MERIVIREFSGNLEDNLNEWLFHLDEQRKALFMASTLQGTAALWAQSLESTVLEDVGSLVRAMKVRFLFGKSQQQLLNELDNLHQTGLIDEYIRRFQLIWCRSGTFRKG